MDKVETNIYDKVEHIYDCAVEILTNSVTGEHSIGWAKMDSPIARKWQDDDQDYIDDINNEAQKWFESLPEEKRRELLDKLFENGLDEIE